MAPDLPSSWDDQKISDFSCLSALLREGIIASLGNAPSAPDSLLLAANVSKTKTLTSRRLGGNWDEREVEMTFCSAYKEFFPSDSCASTIFGEKDFAPLRLRKASPGRFGPSDLTEELRNSLQNGILRPSPLNEFDDKKMTGVVTTWDRKFNIYVGFNELKNLKRLVTGTEGAMPLKDHLQQHLVQKHPKTIF